MDGDIRRQDINGLLKLLKKWGEKTQNHRSKQVFYFMRFHMVHPEITKYTKHIPLAQKESSLKLFLMNVTIF